ncbi:MAG: arsenate reductase family protein [Flavobacteriales bacterium]|jgi:arsenate reductase
MKKIYHLATCSTCAQILDDFGAKAKGFELQDIKTAKITPAQLEEMKELAGTYEALFSRRALKYRELGLNTKTLSENEYKKYILEEYTFLKRPVVINEKSIFIGNAPKVVAQAKASM